MSGLSGIFSTSGKPIDQALLARMNEAISHRGGDGAGLWCKSEVGLGIQLMAVTPESVDEQGPSSLGGQLYLAMDGRLDNRDELEHEFKMADVAFESTSSDSQYVLLAYTIWGRECFERLVGDFALALWDDSQKILLLARDATGCRPLFYHRSEDRIIWGSEIHQLRVDPLTCTKINDLYIAYFLANGGIPGRAADSDRLSAYEDIFRVPRGHFLTVTQDSFRVAKYWDIDPSKKIRYKSDDQYAQHFLQIYMSVIKAQTRSISPIGVMMSGGHDSTSVACTARQLFLSAQDRQPVETFSWISDLFPAMDERRYIDHVKQLSGITSHYINADEYWFTKSFQEVVTNLDEPSVQMHSHYVMWRSLVEQVARGGIRVLLSGHSGNGLFEPSRDFYLMGFLCEGRLRRLFTEASPNVLLKRLAYGLKPLLQSATPGWLGYGFLDPGLGKSRFLSWLNPEFARFLQANRSVLNAGRYRARFWNAERQIRYDWLMGESLGREIEQHICLPLGVDFRSPYLDQRLIEFSLALPIDQKMRDRRTKIMLRNAMKGIVPDEILKRNSRSHFDGLWFLGMEKERRILRAVLASPCDAVKNYLNWQRIRDVFEGETHGIKAKDYFYYKALSLALWLSCRR